MNETDNTLPMSSPPISSSAGNRSQETLLQRGAFGAPATPGTLGKLDRFEILRLLGCGGMGEVYLAREPLTDTQVAIKVMRPESADDPDAAHRFLTEARHMYRLSHPRILRVLEVSDRQEGPYYVMPYIQGGSLLMQFRPGQSLSEEFVLVIARQVAEALAHAHAHGLIHRDLKPCNVLLDKENNAYLTDFGLVRMVTDWAEEEGEGLLDGTVAYLSPALVRGEAEDTRCDIYAFGALLYEMLSGQPPYSGRSPKIILNQILKGPPTSLRELNPKVSPALVKVAEGCMARELHDRYAAMSDVVADLDRIAKGTPPLGPHGRGARFRFGRKAKATVGVAALAGAVAFGLWKLPAGRPDAWKGFSSAENQKQYTYTTNNGACAVTGYIGTDTKAILPDRVCGRPVTAVSDQAFKGCVSLTEATIPASVAVLGKEAFAGCKNLRSIRFLGNAPGGGTYASLFEGDTDAIVYYPPGATGWTETYGGRPAFPREGDFAIGMSSNAVTIVKYAGRTTDVNIPDTICGKPVTTIGDNAFFACGHLRKVTIPRTVTRIGATAFFACPNLASVDNQSCRLFIGGQSFASCGKLTGPISFEGVIGIDTGAFWGCGKLTGIHIPASVTFLGGNPFSGCSSIQSVDVADDHPAFVSVDGSLFSKDKKTLLCSPSGRRGSYNIPVGTETLGSWSIGDASGLTRVTIPDSVTNIGNDAFVACTSLEEIVIPQHVASVGGAAFERCQALTHLDFRGSEPIIGRDVFRGASKVTVRYLPGTKGWGATFGDRPTAVWNLEDQFEFTTDNNSAIITKYKGKDEDVTIPLQLKGLSVETIGNNAFSDHADIVRVSVSDNVRRIGNGTFRNCSRLEDVSFGKNVHSIACEAFAGCTALKELVLPDSGTDINPGLINNCRNLTAIRVHPANPVYCNTSDGVLLSKDKKRLIRYPPGRKGPYAVPSTVSHIGDGSFFGSDGLTAVSIPDGVKAIDGHAWTECTNLTELVIPASVEQISGNMIVRCSRLENIRVDAANPAYCSDQDGVVFSKDKKALVCYPRGRQGAYRVPDGVTYIGFCSFEGCPWLTSVELPDSVVNIEQWAFPGSKALKQVTIPKGVTEIKHCTFYACDSLESVYFLGDAPKIHPEWWWSFGGDPIIYHRWDTKGWGGKLAGKATAVWIPEANGMATNLVSASFVESSAERQGDWGAALLDYENRYDSQANDEAMRSTLRKKFAELRPKAARDDDPAKAGVWKVKAYVFRELDFKWTDNQKADRHAHWKMRDDEIETIRKSLAAFADHVWDGTSGALRIDWSVEVIDKPLTKLEGGDRFWPSPSTVVPFLPAQKPGEADEVMVYVKTRGDKGEIGDAVPSTAPFGHVPPARELGGAVYANFKTGGGEYPLASPGETELHEWLHLAQWILEDRQQYPYGLLASPDGGFDEGELGGDYCYRRKKGKKGWLDYYRHLMREHVTRKMWRELSVRGEPDNVWLRQYVDQALVLGPFDAKGSANLGLDIPFIGETNVTARAGLQTGGREWKALPVAFYDRRILSIDTALGSPVTSVCYVAVNVLADCDQCAQVRIGSDNDSRLLLNGQTVMSVLQPRSITVDQCTTNVNLIRGLNRFLLKVGNNWQGGWCASFRLTASDGGPLTTARYVNDEDIRLSAFFSCATNNGEVKIVKYTGPGGAVTVPKRVGGMPVTTVGDNVFENRSDITSVTLPEGVTSLGTSVFSGCGALATVAVPDSVTRIGDYAFRRSGLTNITLPINADNLGKGLFSDCAKLAHARLPEKLVVIPSDLFLRCGSLAEMSIPPTVTRVAWQAFSGCGSLTNILFRGDVPEGATDTSIFADSPKAIAFHYRGARRWSKEYGGRPADITHEAEARGKLLLSEDFSVRACQDKWFKSEGLVVDNGVLKALSNSQTLETSDTYPNNVIIEIDVEKTGAQNYGRWDFRIGIDSIKFEGTLRFDFDDIDGINIGKATDLPGDRFVIWKEGVNKGTMRLIATHGFMQLVYTNADGERLVSDRIEVPDFESSRVYFCLAGAVNSPRCIDHIRIWQAVSDVDPYIQLDNRSAGQQPENAITEKSNLDKTPNFSGTWHMRRSSHLSWNETYSISQEGPNIRLIINIDSGSNPRVLDFSGKMDGQEHRTTIRGYPARLISWWQDNDLVLHTIREEPAGNEISVKRVLTMSPNGKMIAESRVNSDGSRDCVNILDRQEENQR